MHAAVVDDLSLSVESLLNTRLALHALVDRELRPTDLVALVRTGGGGPIPVPMMNPNDFKTVGWLRGSMSAAGSLRRTALLDSQPLVG